MVIMVDVDKEWDVDMDIAITAVAACVMVDDDLGIDIADLEDIAMLPLPAPP